MAATHERGFRLESPAGAAALNMGLDESLLESAARRQRPVWRFYSWNSPAATFGYFQKYAEVSRLTDLRPLIRRPTGGGLVSHESDWTYSLVFPPQHSWHRRRAREVYEALHEWIRAAFECLGLTTNLSAAVPGSHRVECFSGPERADLVWHDRKIAGAAQRRNRLGLLIQGSVQPPPGARRDEWQRAIYRVGEETLGWSWEDFTADDLLLERAAELAEEKYSQAGYNARR